MEFINLLILIIVKNINNVSKCAKKIEFLILNNNNYFIKKKFNNDSSGE